MVRLCAAWCLERDDHVAQDSGSRSPRFLGKTGLGGLGRIYVQMSHKLHQEITHSSGFKDFCSFVCFLCFFFNLYLQSVLCLCHIIVFGHTCCMSVHRRKKNTSSLVLLEVSEVFPPPVWGSEGSWCHICNICWTPLRQIAFIFWEY